MALVPAALSQRELEEELGRLREERESVRSTREAREARELWAFVLNRARATKVLGLSELVQSVPAACFEIPELKSFSMVSAGLQVVPDRFSPIHKTVKELSLAHNRLSSLPPSLIHLRETLITLSINDNAFTTLPDYIGLFRRLEALELHNNRLIRLADGIGHLLRIKRLILDCNCLTDLPASLAQLPHLAELAINRNRFVRLPEHLATWPALQVLSAAANCISEFPVHLAKCASLRRLDLSSNMIADIPEGVYGFTQLESLSLAFNRLRSLPTTMGGLAGSLTVLQLDGNPLHRPPLQLLLSRGLEGLTDWASNDMATLLRKRARAVVEMMQAICEAGAREGFAPPALLRPDVPLPLANGDPAAWFAFDWKGFFEVVWPRARAYWSSRRLPVIGEKTPADADFDRRRKARQAARLADVMRRRDAAAAAAAEAVRSAAAAAAAAAALSPAAPPPPPPDEVEAAAASAAVEAWALVPDDSGEAEEAEAAEEAAALLEMQGVHGAVNLGLALGSPGGGGTAGATSGQGQGVLPASVARSRSRGRPRVDGDAAGADADADTVAEDPYAPLGHHRRTSIIGGGLHARGGGAILAALQERAGDGEGIGTGSGAEAADPDLVSMLAAGPPASLSPRGAKRRGSVVGGLIGAGLGNRVAAGHSRPGSPDARATDGSSRPGSPSGSSTRPATSQSRGRPGTGSGRRGSSAGLLPGSAHSASEALDHDDYKRTETTPGEGGSGRGVGAVGAYPSSYPSPSVYPPSGSAAALPAVALPVSAPIWTAELTGAGAATASARGSGSGRGRESGREGSSSSSAATTSSGSGISVAPAAGSAGPSRGPGPASAAGSGIAASAARRGSIASLSTRAAGGGPLAGPGSDPEMDDLYWRHGFMTIDMADDKEQARMDIVAAKLALQGTVASLAPATRELVMRRMSVALDAAAAAVDAGDVTARESAPLVAQGIVKHIRRLSTAAMGSTGGLASAGAGGPSNNSHSSGADAAAADVLAMALGEASGAGKGTSAVARRASLAWATPAAARRSSIALGQATEAGTAGAAGGSVPGERRSSFTGGGGLSHVFAAGGAGAGVDADVDIATGSAVSRSIPALQLLSPHSHSGPGSPSQPPRLRPQVLVSPTTPVPVRHLGSLRVPTAATAAGAGGGGKSAGGDPANAAATASALYGGARLHKRRPMRRLEESSLLAAEAAYRSLADPGDFWALTPDDIKAVLRTYGDAGGPVFKEGISVAFPECACVQLGRATRPCSRAAAGGPGTGAGDAGAEDASDADADGRSASAGSTGVGAGDATDGSAAGAGAGGPVFACRATVVALRGAVFTQAELEDRNLALWQEAAEAEAVAEAAVDAEEALSHYDVRAGIAARALQRAYADEELRRRREFEGGLLGSARHLLDRIAGRAASERASAARRCLAQTKILLTRRQAIAAELTSLRAAASGAAATTAAQTGIATPRLGLPGARAMSVLATASVGGADRAALDAGAAAAADVAAARAERIAQLEGEAAEVEADLRRDSLQAALDRIGEAEADAIAAVWKRLTKEVRLYRPLRWWQRGWYAFLLGKEHGAIVAHHAHELRRAYVEQKRQAARAAAGRAFAAMRRVVGNWRRAGLRIVFRAWQGYATGAAAKRRLGK